MTYVTLAVCTAVLGLAAPYGDAQGVGPGMTTAALVKACETIDVGSDTLVHDSEQSMKFGYCTGYMWGVLVSHDFFVTATGLTGGKPLFCAPTDTISVSQAIRVFLKYAKDHPEELHNDPNNIVV